MKNDTALLSFLHWMFQRRGTKSHEAEGFFLPTNAAQFRAATKQIYTVILCAACIDLILAVAKTTGGIFGNSQALVADGIHSSADLLVDCFVFLVARFARRSADTNHPYGHARIETITTAGLGLFLSIVGTSIILKAFFDLLYETTTQPPEKFVLWISGCALIIKESLYHWTNHVAKRNFSELLRASAWHHRLDVAASTVVFAGVAGALAGFPKLDLLSAIFVGALILKMALRLVWDSARELVDTGLQGGRLQLIEAIILAVPGVKSIHQLRTRTMAGQIYVDVHIFVDPTISVSEGHFISERVHDTLLKRSDFVRDVVVHVDVQKHETDASIRALVFLPDRDVLMARLMSCWQDLPEASKIQNIQLHYLKMQIDVEVYFPISVLHSHQGAWYLQEQYQAACRNISCIRSVRLYFSFVGE